MSLATALVSVVLVSAPAQAAPDAPARPRVQAQAVPAPPASNRPRVVCGMTLITPDERTAYTIRELTPPPDGPRFPMTTITGECERPLEALPGNVVGAPFPRRPQPPAPSQPNNRNPTPLLPVPPPK
jgi:hypothetical protein